MAQANAGRPVGDAQFTSLGTHARYADLNTQRPQHSGRAMPNPVVHFEVLGKDAGTLQSFYGQVFDWELNPVMPTYAMVSTGGEGAIAGGVGAPPTGSAGQ